ncbi:MAG: ORF6N domain-containing protein [Elusimicrobia bacterium]|nr:ORF6N domain-containing protein [Candidatus Liberimonas magnetica]
MTKLIAIADIENKIYLIRNMKVMIDRDLAELYGVETRRLNEQVKRNIKRFPSDFMIQLTKEEAENWKSQIATSKAAIKMSLRKRPYAFTQEGIAMLSSVLNSTKAIDVNIQIMRVFIKIREFIYTHKDLAQKISQLERKYDHHDFQIQKLFDKTRDIPMLQEKHIKINGFKKKE